MSLSLASITHNCMPQHQGPEPNYIVNRENGVLLDISNFEPELYNLIRQLFENQYQLKNISASAYKTYLNLTIPSCAQRIYNCLINGEKNG
jgi:hypothetical protein